MKKRTTGIWHSLGTTGKMLVTFTLLYFIAKTFKH